MVTKRLVISDKQVPEGRRKDVGVIVNRLKALGYEISRYEAYSAWDLYSSHLDAGWIILNKDKGDGQVNQQTLELVAPYLDLVTSTTERTPMVKEEGYG